MKHYFTFLLFLFSTQIQAQVSADAGADREICILDTLKVIGKGLNPGDTGSYRWKDITNGITMSSNAQLSVKITSMSPRQYELKVTKTSNGNTYYGYDTFYLTVNALPTFAFKGLPPRCYRDGAINLTGNQITIAKSGDNTQTEADIHYFQLYRKPSWVTGGPVGNTPYVYDFPKYINNASVPKTGLRDTVCYDYTDYKGCYNRECKSLRINPNPIVQLTEGAFCQRNGPVVLDDLVLAPFSKVGGIQSFRVLEVPTGSGVDPSAILSTDNSVTPARTLMDPGQEGDDKTTGDYIVEYCFKDAITGCQSCDTTKVRVVRLPKIEFSAIPKQCVNGPWLALDSLAKDAHTGKHFVDGQWSTVEYNNSRDMSNPSTRAAISNSVKSQKYFDPGTGSGSYMLKLVDAASGCPVRDSFTIDVYGLPIIQLQCLGRVCSNDSPFVLTNVTPSGPVGTWSGTGVSNRKFNPGISPKTKIIEGPYVLQYEYTNPVTGCTNRDTCRVTVETLPKFNPQAVPQKGSKYKVDFTLNSTLFNGQCIWYLGNGDTSTQVNPKDVVFTDSGTYKAYVYSNDFVCFASDSVTFTLDYHVSSIDHLETAIAIYPNPSNGILNIEIPVDANAELSSLSGQVLAKQALHEGNNTVDMSSYSKGMYILQVNVGDRILRRKITLE